MPNLWTHILFGQQILKEIDQANLLDGSEHQRQLFHFACQGPDFLLYHNFFPWKKDKQVAHVGEVMHNEHCGLFILTLLKYMDKHKQDNQITDPLIIYALGFISHYVLDRHVHPYVYYQSGYAPWQHQRFEVFMDTLIVDKLKGIETWKTPSWKQIYLGKELPKEVVTMLEQVFKQVYPHLQTVMHEKAWQQAYRHMYQAHWLFHDPLGWKRKITLGQIDPLVYKREVPDVDILNETNRRWSHPSAEEETFTYSVWDLWEMALVNATEIFQLVLEWTALDQEEEKEEIYASLKASLGDYSYDSGKPCGENFPLRFAEPII